MVDNPLESRFFYVLMYFTLRFGILKPFWIDVEQGGSECRAWRFISFCLMFSRLYTHTESTSRLLFLREPFTLTILYPFPIFLAASNSLSTDIVYKAVWEYTHTIELFGFVLLFFQLPLFGFFSAVSLFQNYTLFFPE